MPSPLMPAVGEHIDAMLRGVNDQLDGIVSEAGKTEEKIDKRKAWNQLKSLSHDEFRVASETLAEKAGHVPGETEPCSFHAFMQEMIGK